jgi:hypothetical protein
MGPELWFEKPGFPRSRRTRAEEPGPEIVSAADAALNAGGGCGSGRRSVARRTPQSLI